MSGFTPTCPRCSRLCDVGTRYCCECGCRLYLTDGCRAARVADGGAGCVTLYKMPPDDLERLVEAVQLIDSEGVEILDRLAKFDAEFATNCDTEGL